MKKTGYPVYSNISFGVIATNGVPFGVTPVRELLLLSLLLLLLFIDKILDKLLSESESSKVGKSSESSSRFKVLFHKAGGSNGLLTSLVFCAGVSKLNVAPLVFTSGLLIVLELGESVISTNGF